MHNIAVPQTTDAPAMRSRKTFWQRWQRSIKRAGVLLLLILFSVIFLVPFVWLFITAIKPVEDLAAFPIKWWPSHPEWSNFLQATMLIDFWHFAWNSVFLSTLQAVLVTLTSALVGYGFARLRGKGKRTLFIVMLSMLMLPAVVGLIPTYVIFSRLGLINTYWPWVLWGLASSPFLSFLFRQFFSTIPLELEEAAIVDGCTYLRIFWQIFLPLSKPVLATSLILSFSGVWGDWLSPDLFLNPDKTTLAVAIATGYQNARGIALPNVLAAGCILYIIPMLVLFFLLQRYFTRGIVLSGLRG